MCSVKHDNFFEHNDLTKGIYVLNNNEKVSKLEDIGENTQTIKVLTQNTIMLVCYLIKVLIQLMM